METLRTTVLELLTRHHDVHRRAAELVTEGGALGRLGDALDLAADAGWSNADQLAEVLYGPDCGAGQLKGISAALTALARSGHVEIVRRASGRWVRLARVDAPHALSG